MRKQPIRKPVQKRTRLRTNLAKSTRPAGKSWKPLNPGTIKRLKLLGNKSLFRQWVKDANHSLVKRSSPSWLVVSHPALTQTYMLRIDPNGNVWYSASSSRVALKRKKP